MTPSSQLIERVVGWRRHLHSHPELAFAEHETARYIAEQLAPLDGLAISRPTPTSVLAVLRTGRPGPTLALRADIDGLPIEEETGLPFASVNAGKMHACGHDGHAAILLGAAHALTAAADELRGELRFIFQHAEELQPGGARELVAAGVMDGVDLVYGHHLWAPLEVGAIALSPGPMLAAADTFSIELRGAGGHAAMPHTAKDVIAATAAVIDGLQRIVAREVDPLAAAVVSVTEVHAGTALNVLPEHATLRGTARALEEPVRTRLAAAIERVAAGVAAAHGIEARTDFQLGYAPVVNDAGAVATVERALARVTDARLIEQRPMMGGDDFSAYLQEAPGCYALIGARPAADAHPHHHPRFDIDERALAIGVAAMTAVAREVLGRDELPRTS